MIYKANCKINLGLSIVSKREDGFHNLSTVMYPVKGLYDMVEIVKSDSFKFSSSGLVVDCSSESNLCVKAYNLLKQQIPTIEPLHIHLHKTTPFGAGLGGGSSDATAVLCGINHFLGLNISEERLIELASQLGSDTPFFVRNRAQLCTGRGEIMEDIAIDLEKYELTIVKPDVFISTKEAFSSVIAKEPQFDLQKLPLLPLEEWKNVVVNDFEEGICSIYPEIGEIKEALYKSGAIYASLSGSGSALFAISDKKLDVEELLKGKKVSVFHP